MFCINMMKCAYLESEGILRDCSLCLMVTHKNEKLSSSQSILDQL